MIKIFDPATGEYKIVASNRGDLMYTKSIAFDSSAFDASNYEDDDSNIITIDEALYQLKKEIRETKEGVAWVYKNGTIGGGGGTGGGNISFKVDSPNYQITNGQIIVNNGDNVPLNFSIKGSGIGRKMIITIRDKDGNVYDGYRNATYVVSSKSTTITIPSITSDTYIEFSGYDAETLSMIEPYTLNIKVAALKITGPDAIQIPQSDTEYIVEYSIETTDGQMTTLVLTTEIEGKKYTYNHPSYFTYNTKIALNIFDIFVDDNGNKLDLYDAISRGAALNFTINATIVSGGYNAKCLTSVVVTDPTKITIDIIPLDNISSAIKDSADEDYYVQIENFDNTIIPGYQYIENNNIIFTVKLYFSTQQYRMYYELYQFDDNNNPVTIFKKGNFENYLDISNQPTGTTYYQPSTQITIPYTSLDNINPSKPVFVYIKAWDKVDPTTYTGEVTKWFGIQNDSTWQAFYPAMSGKDAYDNYMNYLYYYWNQNAISDIPGDIWQSERIYKGSLTTSQTIKGRVKYYNCNNITNGLVLRGGGLYDNNMMRLSSNAYAIITDNSENNFIPFKANSDKNWMFDANGWTMSFLINTDIQPDIDNVIISYANYDALDNFIEGIYITTEDVKVILKDTAGKIDKFNLSAKLAQGMLNQIDIVFKPGTKYDTKGQLKLYINGVLAAAGISADGYFDFNDTNKSVTSIETPFTFAAKNSTRSGVSKQADVNFYRIMFYKRWLSDFHIVKNYIQGQAEVNLLPDGNIDTATNIELRNRNFFFGNDGKCSLIDDRESNWTTNCERVTDLYSKLTADGKNPLPIVLVTIDDTQGDDFRNVVNSRYSENEVAADKKAEESQKKITKKYTAAFDIIPAKSTAATAFSIGVGKVNSATTDFSQTGKPWITLQGTSTLGYLSKNFQIGFGNSDTKGDHLVQVFEDMLPENEYILKADVMDSGHANNAAIGKFINDFLGSDEQLILPSTARNNNKNMYKKEVKHTTLGHPCILFIKYRDTENPVFHGIYSFNLGRISYYNLGYNVFDGYYKVSSGAGEGATEYQVEYDNNHKVTNSDIKFPAYVSSYKAIPIPYTSDLVGLDSNYSTAVCYECNKNDNAVGSFQQYKVIESFYDRVYPSETNTNTEKSLDNFRKIFVATANMYGADPNNDITRVDTESSENAQRSRTNLIRNHEGMFLRSDNNEYEVFNIDNYNAGLYTEFDTKWAPTSQFLSFTSPQGPSPDEEFNVGLVWDHASAYFVLAMLFGLTDSLGKNLNIRSFDQKSWYTSFYDMDTGLALTNSGNETVKKDAYLDVFGNNANGNAMTVNINGYTSGGYDTFNSRLWNIVRFLTNTYDENDGEKPKINYRKIWEALRTGMLIDPNNFIDNYYISQNNNVGEIIFNQDYYEKYVQDEVNKIDNPDKYAVSSISLLHGNRINFVKDWFTKHVYFLDGVFDLGCKDTTKSQTAIEMYGSYAANNQVYGGGAGSIITSLYNVNEENAAPYTIMSNQADRVNPPTSGYRTFKVKSNLPMFFVYANSTNGQRMYIPEGKETTISLNLVGGNEQTMSYNFVPYLTKFDKLGNMFYVTMSDINLRSLTELDLSNMKTLSGVNFSISKMVELRRLNMENVTTHDPNAKLSVNLVNSSKINYINLRNAAVNSLSLPGSGKNPGGSLETLIIDGTTITEIDLTNQAMLSTFSASDCPVLKTVIFNNNHLLKNVGTLPTTLETLKIDECKSLEDITINGMTDLGNWNDNKKKGFYIGKVPALKNFSYSAANDKDTSIWVTNIDLSGATNLETIYLAGFKGDHITLALSAKQTLKSINFSNSNINHIVWKDENGNAIVSKVGYSTTTSYADFDYINVFDFGDCPKLMDFNLSKTTIRYLVLPDNKTFNVDTAITDCISLERVIGNISITNNNLIKGLPNFRFNEVARDDISSPGDPNKGKTTNTILDFETGNFSIVSKDELETLGEFDIITDEKQNRYINVRNLATNFTLDVKDAKELCKSSGINISDMYSVLIKLGDKITVLESTFEDCKNINVGLKHDETTLFPNFSDSFLMDFYPMEKRVLRDDVFAKNINIKILNKTFAGCNINGRIGWQGVNEHIFHKLTNLEEIIRVFDNCGQMGIYTNNIFNYNNIIKVIEYPFASQSIGYETNLSIIFKQLPNIETVIGLFYGTGIALSVDYYTHTLNDGSKLKVPMIFYNNPKLKTLSNWINTTSAIISSKYLDLSDIFGGVSRWLYNTGQINSSKIKYNGTEYDLNTTYPRELKDLSFAFATATASTDSIVLDWTHMDRLFYNIGYDINNISYLEKCSNIFNNISYILPNVTEPYAKNADGTYAKFPVNIFNVVNEQGEQIYFNNLSEAKEMFQNAAFKDTLDFPGNIFKYCRNKRGLDISGFLKNTIVMPINLVSVGNYDKDSDGNLYDCFKYCTLTNVSYLFDGCAKTATVSDLNNPFTTYYDNGGVRNPIPYKFFYMEDENGNVKSTIENMEGTFKNCNWMGCRVDGKNGLISRLGNEFAFYITKRPALDELVRIRKRVTNGEKVDPSELMTLVTKTENGLYDWDTWSYDGMIITDEYLSMLDNEIIKNINNGKIASGDSYLEAKYKAIENYQDFIINDNNYADLADIYYKHPGLENAKYDYTETTDNEGNNVLRIYYDADKDPKFVNYNDNSREGNEYTVWGMGKNLSNMDYNINTTLPTKFVANYMLPMDIFRYCTSNCKINNIFENLSRFNKKDRDDIQTSFIYGLIGRIPPRIFEPLKDLTEMKNIFTGCRGLVPYSQTFDGLFYRFMLKHNIALTAADYMFSNVTILGALSTDFIKNNKSLQSLEGMFKNGYMVKAYADGTQVNDYINFIPKDLFVNNIAIRNISQMFGKDDSSDDNSMMYFDIYDNLCTQTNNPALTNTNGLFYNQSGLPKSSDTAYNICRFHEWVVDYVNTYYGTNFKNPGYDSDIAEKYGFK